MLWHVVLFAPRPGLTAAEEEKLASALERAARDIPAVRRAQVGRRLPDGPRYAAGGPVDFPYAAILEFDDAAALREYLGHPAHADLGRLFNQSLSAAVVCDYEMGPVDGLRGWRSL
jgi:hypothetical protein